MPQTKLSSQQDATGSAPRSQLLISKIEAILFKGGLAEKEARNLFLKVLSGRTEI